MSDADVDDERGTVTFWTPPTLDEMGNRETAMERVLRPIMKSMHGVRRRVCSDPALPIPGEREVVVTMGNAQLEVLQDRGLYPKNRKVTGLRGTSARGGEGWYLPTYDPVSAFMDPSKPGEIRWDAMLAHRLATTGTRSPTLGEYGYTRTLRWVREYIEAEYQRRVDEGASHEQARVDVACDLETMGFFPWYPEKKIVSFAASVVEGASDIVYLLDPKDSGTWAKPWPEAEWRALMADVEWLLNDPRVRLCGNNLKFDLLWIRVKWEITCSNFERENMIIGTLVDENRSNSLNQQAKELTPLGGYDDRFDKAQPKDEMESVPACEDGDDFSVYAGGDTDASLRVNNVLWPALREHVTTHDGRPSKRSPYQLYRHVLLPAVRAFETIEYRGMHVDQGRYRDLKHEIDGRRHELRDVILDYIPETLRERHTRAGVLKVDLPNLVRAVFFSPEGLGLEPQIVTEKSGQASTAGHHLKMFRTDYPELVDAYDEYDKLTKVKRTYIKGFLKHLRPDGFFHPTFFLGNIGREDEDESGGSVTGRSSAKDPAVQTLPKRSEIGKRLRRCFTAPPGYRVLSRDYSQGELRVTACWANEVRMIEAYLKGVDLHALTASGLNGMTLDEFYLQGAAVIDDMRTGAKAANFGAIYGISAEGFQAYAWKEYGIVYTLEEAEAVLEGFFDTYPGLRPWHNRQIQEAEETGQVRSPLGRVRHLPHIYSPDRRQASYARRQSINSPIQSTLNELCLWAIARLHARYPDLWIAGMVHDNIICYVPEDEVRLWDHRIDEVMSTLPITETFGWEPQLEFPSDGEAGPSLGELEALAA